MHVQTCYSIQRHISLSLLWWKRERKVMYVKGSIVLSSGQYGVCSKDQVLSSLEAQRLECEGQLVNVYIRPSDFGFPL